MEPKIEKITIEKLDRHSKVTRYQVFMIRYTVYLDNGETHTAITPLKPTISKGREILNNLLDKAMLGAVNERRVVKNDITNG